MCEQEEAIRSVGRRKFPILKHHSIYCGAVFGDENIIDHIWNCNSLRVEIAVKKKRAKRNGFRLTDKLSMVPLIFE